MDYCQQLVNIILDNVYSLSMQKYSSNVVEKCLEISNEVIILLNKENENIIY